MAFFLCLSFFRLLNARFVHHSCLLSIPNSQAFAVVAVVGTTDHIIMNAMGLCVRAISFRRSSSIKPCSFPSLLNRFNHSFAPRNRLGKTNGINHSTRWNHIWHNCKHSFRRSFAEYIFGASITVTQMHACPAPRIPNANKRNTQPSYGFCTTNVITVCISVINYYEMSIVGAYNSACCAKSERCQSRGCAGFAFNLAQACSYYFIIIWCYAQTRTGKRSDEIFSVRSHASRQF